MYETLELGYSDLPLSYAEFWAIDDHLHECYPCARRLCTHFFRPFRERRPLRDFYREVLGDDLYRALWRLRHDRMMTPSGTPSTLPKQERYEDPDRC